MLAIKHGEKRFREEALLLHPDTATGLAVQLQPRCEEAMKFLENALDAIKKAFQATSSQVLRAFKYTSP